MPRIYVGTYAKYNNGSIKGAWLDLEDYPCKQDFYEACAELHSDEVDLEPMFQDWEDIPAAFISESHIDEEFWNYMDSEIDDDAKQAYRACFDKWDEGDFNDRYRGQYRDWGDMAEDYLEGSGLLEAIPESLRYYFDYAAYGRDMRMNGDMVEDNFHFFWNH